MESHASFDAERSFAAISKPRRRIVHGDIQPGTGSARRLLEGPQRYTCLVGGTRSGKTFLIVRAIIMRALRAKGSRHAILRFHANKR